MARGRLRTTNFYPEQKGGKTATWTITGNVEPGSTELHFASYDGLCVGDILEIDAGRPHAETIVIGHLGSVHLVSPLRNGHERGAQIRRLIEGTGISFA